MSCITIFGSSRPKPGETQYEEARKLGALLAQAGFSICNGGYGGTMEGSARGAKETGGHTVGVICERFGLVANPYIQETIIVKTHSERLHKLIELGDAYIVLRGSTGTLVELALVWEYMNKSLMPEKPIIVVGNFWKPVVETLNEEFMFEGKESATRFVMEVEDVSKCISCLLRRF